MRQDRVAIPETRYAKAGDGVHIAYQVTGAGPLKGVPGTWQTFAVDSSEAPTH